MGQQGSRAGGSSDRTPFSEAGRREFEAFQQLLSSASGAHKRALEAHREFLDECGALQDGLASLEARVLQNLGAPGAEALAVENHQVENHQGCLRAAAEACGSQIAEVPHGSVSEVRAPVGGTRRGAEPRRCVRPWAAPVGGTPSGACAEGLEPAPACGGTRRGAMVRWAEEAPQCDDSASTQNDGESSDGTPAQPPLCKGRPQPAPLRASPKISEVSGCNGVVAWPEWNGEKLPSSKGSSTRTPTSRNTSTLRKALSGLRKPGLRSGQEPTGPSPRSLEETHKRGCCQRMVILPTSPKRTAWDMFSILILGYDCVMIPLSVFGLGGTPFFTILESFITLFWSIDIVLSFLSAYYTLGGVETRLHKIARRYIRSNFLFDITLVLVDFMLNVSKFLEGDAVRLMRMGKVIRFGKVFRLLRILRIMKMPKAFEGIMEAMQSKTFNTFLGIAQAVCLIAITNHFIACMWYAVSDGVSKEWGMPAWIHESGVEGRSIAYVYFTALHWSITQFTPSSMEVQPKNVPERIFAIIVVFAALMVFSSFVSGITSAMTSLREYNNYRHTQLENIRRYVLDKRISLDLSNRIGTFIQANNFMAKRKIIESDVDVFAALPTSMRYQLRWEAHSEVISAHHFFFQVGEHQQQALRDICYKVVTERLIDSARDVFCPGNDAIDMFFLLGGTVDYYRGEEEVAQFQPRGDKRPVFCELALWIRFAHAGRLSCRTAAEFLVLPSGSFRGCIAHYRELHDACCEYVREFSAVLSADSEPRGWDVLQNFDDLQAIAQRAFDCAFETVENDDSPTKREGFAAHSKVKMNTKMGPSSDVNGSTSSIS